MSLLLCFDYHFVNEQRDLLINDLETSKYNFVCTVIWIPELPRGEPREDELNVLWTAEEMEVAEFSLVPIMKANSVKDK